MALRDHPEILFIHHTAMWYRKPFFRKLSELYNVKFLFTRVHDYNEKYGIKIDTKIEGMEGINYKLIKNHFNIAFGAIKETMGDYDIFVGGSWDTPQDVLETLFYFLIVKIRRKPFILWREDWDWKVKSLKRSLVKAFAGFIGRNADAILVPGTRHMEFFTSLGADTEKIFIMPNVSSIEHSKVDDENKEKIREKLGLKDKKVVLYVGRLISLKGVNYLIESFAKLADKMDYVVLIIVGEGKRKEELELFVKELGIEDRVYFTGNVDNHHLGGYYLLSNVFVLPSVTTYFADACPLVVNEAMYFGRPVVTSDAVGTTFMIKNGENGFVVPERDSDSLCNVIYEILSDSSLEKKMGKNAKKLIDEGFRYENMIEGFNKAIKHVKK